MARKALGQYFLVDRTVLQSILSAAELDPQDIVVEVGPGRGRLTRHLVRRAKKVIAIEIDDRLAASLARSLDNPPNLNVINADARDIDLRQVLDRGDGYKLVANLPYYAANPIVRRFLEEDELRPSLMVVMFQKEVAARMVAGTGRMSLLAVAIQLYGVPRIIRYVPPSAFSPSPKVDSAVVRIDPLPHPASGVDNVKGFFDMVKAGFSAPRKQLRNSLCMGLGISVEQTTCLLEQARVDPRRRAENLTLEEWKVLYHAGEERRSRWTSKPTPR